MDWQELRREEVIDGILRHYREKITHDPQQTLTQIDQELHSQSVRFGNDWVGRGVVMDTVITATIEGLEIVRSYCLESLHTNNGDESSGE